MNTYLLEFVLTFILSFFVFWLSKPYAHAIIAIVLFTLGNNLTQHNALNPALSFSKFCLGQINAMECTFYVVAEIVGALIGAVVGLYMKRMFGGVSKVLN
jgi:glycerol uptake facilitator-like aquaporin